MTLLHAEWQVSTIVGLVHFPTQIVLLLAPFVAGGCFQKSSVCTVTKVQFASGCLHPDNRTLSLPLYKLW